MLSIHEYLAMNILRENGISVPKYEVADSAQKAFDIATDFGKYWVYLIFRAHCKQIQGGTGGFFSKIHWVPQVSKEMLRKCLL